MAFMFMPSTMSPPLTKRNQKYVYLNYYSSQKCELSVHCPHLLCRCFHSQHDTIYISMKHCGMFAKPLLPWKSSKYYTFCVSVALVIQHVKHMCYIMLSSVACIAPPYFSTFSSHKPRETFGKHLVNIRCMFWPSLQFLSETFLILRRNQEDNTVNVHRCSCTVYIILAWFMKLEFFDRFLKNTQISNFMKNGSQVIPCRWMDKWT